MENIKIIILKGDITERETDAIINTSNDRLILGSGLGGAIRAKGGNSIVEECSRYGPIELGDAVITGAGSLKTKHIIHVALSRYDGTIEEQYIALSLSNSLKLANTHSFRSIAIPDMSVGIIRFSPHRAASCVFKTLKNFIEKENKSLELVEVVVWDIDTLHIYKQAHKEIFIQHKTG